MTASAERPAGDATAAPPPAPPPADRSAAVSPLADRSLRARARVALARRDLLEFVRDRRTLFVTLLLPMAMYPILALSSALGVRTAISDIDSRQAPAALMVVLTGAPADARALAARIESLPEPETPSAGWPASLSFGYATADEARDALEHGHADLWIEVPADAVETIDGVGTLALEARGPESRPLEPRIREQFQAVVRGLAADARQRRIERAGLPESLLTPVALRFGGMAEPAGTIQTRGLLPTAAGGVFVLLAVLTMTGAFYPAIDAIAGEKERGTIETLLIAPCAAIDIVAGKFLAVWAVALATLVANVVSIVLTAAVAVRFLPDNAALMPEGSLPTILVVSLLAFVGLSAVAAAMCLVVTTASKSGKEAQNTLTPVLLFASALAGAGLLSDPRHNPFIAAVPFAGQVSLARATLVPAREAAAAHDQVAGLERLEPRQAADGFAGLALPLATSLLSAAVLVWLLLQGTAALLTDEEILFRGPDAAGGALARPARRRRPTVGQGLTALGIGLAGLWYAQGVASDDFAVAIPVHQIAGMLLPLALLLAWQRVDLRRTFALRWPGVPGPGRAGRAVAAIAGAALVGAGLFVVGAAVLLALRRDGLSPEAEALARKLVSVMRDRPAVLSWALIALVPAVCEELLFRGWVQSAFVGAWPSRGRIATAVAVQAICFALFHLLPERMPQTLVLGLVAGAITLATGSLLPAIACHAAHNSMPIVLLWLAGGLSGPLPDPAGAAGATLPRELVAACVIALFVGATAVALASRRGAVRIGGFLPAAVVLAAALLPATGFAADAAAGGGDQPAQPPNPLRVAVMPIAAGVEWKADRPQGPMIDIWRELEQRLGVRGEFVRMGTFKDLLESLPAGTADVALGPIAITEERERIMDLTHPIIHSGLRLAVREKHSAGVLPALASLLSWQLIELLGVVVLLALASGHLLWWFEHGRNPESFPARYPQGVFEAIWWIVSTIVSGGCDNKHVASALGRAIALAWMTGGIMLVAALTSMLTATLTAEQVAGRIHGPRDITGRTIGCQEGAVTVAAVRRRGGVPREFRVLDEAFEALALGLVEAVVGENQQLTSMIQEPGRDSFRLVGPLFESFDYGLGLPSGSPLREPLNAAILQMREEGSIDRTRERWMGRHE
jgi:polar amino acid transport system substrate-binding protein